MKLGELFVQLGVKADTFTVRDFSRAIGDIPLVAAGAITSLTGLSLGFMEMTKHTLDISNNLSLFRAETGLSIEELQRWQGVARQVGLSGDVMAQSIIRISQAIAQMRLGHADPNFLLAMGQVGINPASGNAFQVMNQLMAASKKFDPRVMSAALSNMGLSPELMRVFELSPKDFDRMKGRGVIMGDGDTKAMQQFQESVAALTMTLEKSFAQVVVEFEPYMKDLTEVLRFLVVHMGGWALKGLGEDARLFEEFQKKGFSQTMADMVAGQFGADINRDITGNREPAHVSVVQNIHSTADAGEVARIAKEHLDREKQNAMKSMNNSGY